MLEMSARQIGTLIGREQVSPLDVERARFVRFEAVLP